MADYPLLNDYAPDIKLNNPTPHPNATPVHIVVDPSDPLDSPVHDDTTLVFIKTLQADTVVAFPIAVHVTK